jgi:uncharacterized protein (DUF302 family)
MENQSPTPKQMLEMFTIKVSSKKNANEIASKMQEACDVYNFALLKEYIYHEIVESKGFPITRKVFIYEVCQAKMASKILTTNPEFSIFMPCKISVYEQEGLTIISTMNMEMMLKIFEENKEMYQEATALFETLINLINSLK